MQVYTITEVLAASQDIRQYHSTIFSEKNYEPTSL